MQTSVSLRNPILEDISNFLRPQTVISVKIVDKIGEKDRETDAANPSNKGPHHRTNKKEINQLRATCENNVRHGERHTRLQFLALNELLVAA